MPSSDNSLCLLLFDRGIKLRVEGLLHNLLKCKRTVSEKECAVHRAGSILDAMACKVYPAAFFRALENRSYGGSTMIQLADTRVVSEGLQWH
jgi:hypothetical protein